MVNTEPFSHPLLFNTTKQDLEKYLEWMLLKYGKKTKLGEITLTEGQNQHLKIK